MDDIWDAETHHPLGFKQHPKWKDAVVFPTWVNAPPKQNLMGWMVGLPWKGGHFGHRKGVLWMSKKRCWKGPMVLYLLIILDTSEINHVLFLDLCSWCFIRCFFLEKIGPEPNTNKEYKFSGTIWYQYPGVERVHKTKRMLNKTDVKIHWTHGWRFCPSWVSHTGNTFIQNNITHYKAKTTCTSVVHCLSATVSLTQKSTNISDMPVGVGQILLTYCKWFKCFFVPFFPME